MSRHISSRVQDAEWEVMWLKSLLGRRVFVPLFFPLKSINLFPYSLTANNSVSAFLVCQFVLFPMSLLSCSLFKIAYPMFPRKKNSWWASGKCVDSYHVLTCTCILEVIPPVPVLASLESYVREASFLWVKSVRKTRTTKLIRFM